jgi:hypothetical protein
VVTSWPARVGGHPPVATLGDAALGDGALGNGVCDGDGDGDGDAEGGVVTVAAAGAGTAAGAGGFGGAAKAPARRAIPRVATTVRWNLDAMTRHGNKRGTAAPLSFG